MSLIDLNIELTDTRSDSSAALDLNVDRFALLTES
jgi:hypothetical protein